MSNTSNDALSPKTFVNLLTDSGFKAVYTDRSNMDLLIELLNCLLPEEARVEEIESFEDREQDPDDGKRTEELAPPTIFTILTKATRFTKTPDECRSDKDFLFYWFLNGWKYDNPTD